MQTAEGYVRTPKPSVKQRCAALDFSSPRVVTDQVLRTSPDGFLFGKENGVSFTMSHIASALRPRSLLIATDFSEASEKALRHSLALARFYGTRFCLAHVVSSLGLTMAGPDAVAASEEATLREAADLQESLVRTGALSGIQHKFVVRHGELWPELHEIIRQENTDLLVVGTHGRYGIAKLFFGSIAEQIFREADCPVLIFGPRSQEHPWIGTPSRRRTFLFATDFGQASLYGLSQAIAVANDFGAKLVFLNVIPAVAPHQRDLHADSRELREDRYRVAVQRLAELTRNAAVDVRADCHVEFESERPISEWILDTAETRRADLIIMGLHDSAHTGLISHLNWTTAYDVVCRAGSPVLSVNPPSRSAVIPTTSTEVTVSSLSQGDLIRIRGLGVKW